MFTLQNNNRQHRLSIFDRSQSSYAESLEHVFMFRFSPRLYPFRSQRCSIHTQSAKQLDNTSRKVSRYPKVGQNLSDRYLRLEKSLRGGKEGSDYSHGSSSSIHVLLTPLPKPVQVFHGFEIPKEPKPPADDECCMSGCAICVYDLYEETLQAYKEAVLSLQNSLSALHIPEDQWPSSIRHQSSSEHSGRDKRKEIVLNAFEEMERTLKLKRQSEAEAQARIKTRRNQLVPKKEKLSLSQASAQLYEAFRWMFVNR